MAMAMTLFSLALLSVIGFALVTLTLTEYKSSANNVRMYQAYNCARAGIARAMTELRFNYNWGTGGNVSGLVGGGTYSVSVLSYGAGAADKCWLVTSIGQSGGASRVLKVWMELESFAKFAYFTVREQTAAGTTIWFVDKDSISGAAHTNGYFSIYQHPKFSDKVTSYNASDPYYRQQDRSYRQDGQSTFDTSRFYHYYSGYGSDSPVALNGSPSFSFAGGQPEIPLPKDTGQIQANADYSFTGNVTITLKNNGTADVKKSNGQTQTISTTAATIHISGQTYIQGTLSGRLTIGSTGTIHITDNILYNNRRTDVLGMVSEGHIVVDTARSGDLEIDGALMALNNSFYVEGYNQGWARGTLHIFGSLIQKNRGAVGTFNANTGNIQTGYVKDYVYDQKLIDFPPLNFPTTGKIMLKAWRDMGSLGN
jgi:hypothetical protein